MSPLPRRVLWVFGGVVLGAALALTAVVAWLSTGTGRAFVTERLRAAVPGLAIEGEAGGLFDLAAAAFTLSDRDGVWLRVEGARLDWSPLALLRGTVAVDRLSADRVSVARAPVSDHSPAPAPDAADPLRLPVAVTVDRLAIARAELGADLLGGRPAVITVEGAAALPSGRLGGTADIAVRRIDDNPGTATLKAAYDPGRRLMLDLRVDEPADGMIAGLLDVPGRPPVTLTLTGDGPPTDWTGALKARAGDAAAAEAEARIRPVPGGFTFGGTAKGAIAALLPAGVRPLVGDAATLAAGGLVLPEKRVALDGLTLTTAAGVLSGQGVYDLATANISSGFTVTLGPESTVHRVMTEPVFEAAVLEATVSGPAATPTIRATLTAARPAFGTIGAERMRAELSADPKDRMGRWDFALTTALADLGGDDPALAAVVGPDTTLSAKGSLETAQGTIRLSTLVLETAAVTARGDATLRGWGREAEAAVDLAAPDLAPLAGLTGIDLGGAATARVRLSRTGGIAKAEVAADGRGVRTGIPAADALLGPETVLRALVESGADLSVPSLSLATGRMRLDGRARLEGERLTGTAAAAIPDLSPLGAALGTGLTGALTLDADIDGPPAALVADLRGRGTDLTVNGQALGPTKLQARLRGLPQAPEGTIALDGTMGAAPLALTGGFAVAGDRLRLRDAVLRIGPNTAKGALTADLDSRTATGALALDLPDLSPIGALAAVPIGGAATGKLDLDAAGGRQRLVLDAAGRGLSLRTSEGLRTLSRIRLSGRIDDALATPRLDLRLEAAEAAAGRLRLGKAAATLQGPLSGAAFTADLTGSIGRPLSVAAAGTLASKGAATTVALTRLDGRLGTDDLRAARPARLTVDADGFAVQGLDLRSGRTRIALDAALGAKDFRAEATLAAVPVVWLSLLDESLDFEGRLDAKAVLTGSAKAPRGDLSVRLDDLRSPALRRATGAAGLDMAADGAWRDGRLDLTARAESPRGGIDLRATASLPLVLVDGTTPTVPETQRIRAELDGSVELDRFNDLLAASGDRIGGKAIFDLSFAGTLLDRQLSGTVAVNDGRYENQALGTSVRAITARLAGTPEGLTVRQFTGRTPGSNGTVAVSGAIRFDPAGGPRADMRLVAERAQVVRTDLATAVADADLTLAGGLSSARLAGRIQVREARIQLPERLPREIVDLDVVEIGPGARSGKHTAPKTAPHKTAPAERAGPVVALALDVTAANQIYVQGRGLDAEFQADLDVRGTVAEPLVTGQVTRVKGALSLLGQTFDLARATLTFQGDGTLDPALDIQARTTRGDVTAIVNVTGRTQKPEVKLESEPPAPEDEVLARLLFNRGVGQLSALEAVQLAQSAGQLTGVIGGGPGILDSVKRSLGVDRLEFKGSETGQGPGTVAAGRYVGEKVYVGVEQELGTGQSKATVQYDVNRNIRLQGAVGSESRAGVKFEWDY